MRRSAPAPGGQGKAASHESGEREAGSCASMTFAELHHLQPVHQQGHNLLVGQQAPHGGELRLLLQRTEQYAKPLPETVIAKVREFREARLATGILQETCFVEVRKLHTDGPEATANRVDGSYKEG
jgi:hypothetical protein